MPSSTFNSTQWYVNCAQVNIIGGGGGSLEGYKYAKFPGTYNVVDPGECFQKLQETAWIDTAKDFGYRMGWTYLMGSQSTWHLGRKFGTVDELSGVSQRSMACIASVIVLKSEVSMQEPIS